MYDEIKSLDGNYISGTPPDVGSLMVRWLEIDSNTLEKITVLEPGAGDGNLIEALLIAQNRAPNVWISFCESNEVKRKMLLEKYPGLDFVSRDFFKVKKQKFDRIILNPPLRNDIDHITHAYELLNKGGRLVALVHTVWENSTIMSYYAFRKWLESQKYMVVYLDKKWFNNTRPAHLIIIDKPHE